jgi:hypothetical protein
MDNTARLAFLGLGLAVGIFVGAGVAWVLGQHQIGVAELARARVERDREIERTKLDAANRDLFGPAQSLVESQLRAGWRSARADLMPKEKVAEGLARCEKALYAAALATGGELAR